jgi:hypothetical protein
LSELQLAKKSLTILIFISFATLSFSGCSAGDSILSQKCKNLVLDQLKSPSTAVFSNISLSKVDDHISLLDGAVDSENGFGATVRADFECQVYDNNDVTLMSLRQR